MINDFIALALALPALGNADLLTIGRADVNRMHSRVSQKDAHRFISASNRVHSAELIGTLCAAAGDRL